jgi:hypothetical protein
MTDRERAARNTLIRDLGWLTPAERTHLAEPDTPDADWLRHRLNVPRRFGLSSWGFLAFVVYFFAVAGPYAWLLALGGETGQEIAPLVMLSMLLVVTVLGDLVRRRRATYRALLALADPDAPELERRATA